MTSLAAGVYFTDGERTIDFVLVYRTSSLSSDDEIKKIMTYINNIVSAGVQIETATMMSDKDVNFIKLHMPYEIVLYFADVYDIDLAFMCTDYRPPFEPPVFHFMSSPLTLYDPHSIIFSRAPVGFAGKPATQLTYSEKILVLSKLLSKTRYGYYQGEYGIEKLYRENIFETGFPLHEGSYEWTETGPLTDRQLLAEYWGSLKCWYKYQPLHLIESYFGTEYGFYFTWLGFYIKMLMPAAILSLLCLMYGFVTFRTDINELSNEICRSDKLLCPRCHYTNCKFEYLKHSCAFSYMSYLFNNTGTLVFAIVMSFWSTIFMELWGRNETFLQLRWNVKSLENDTTIRPQYAENTRFRILSPVTGLPEPFVPKRTVCCRYVISCVSLLLLLILMILATFGVMVYRIAVTLMMIETSKEKIVLHNRSFIAAGTGSLISAIFIFIFKMIYLKLALMLTDMENHRTQVEYDNSYILKSYALAFTNNYSAVFYIAFFKGRFYTYPGDMSLWDSVGGIRSDMCDITGCILDLSLQLLIILLMKLFITNCLQILLPILWQAIKKWRGKVQRNEKGRHQYEEDYHLAENDQYFLVDEYMEMVIQYGFVTFFIAGFPISPIIALINNIIELRVDAAKMTKHFRRPVPNRVTGLGAWYSILQAITFIGVTTNALVVAFTSEFVPKFMYMRTVQFHLKGFLNWTISEFESKDFKIRNSTIGSDVAKYCYYPGLRYPPDHERKYTHTKNYWFLLAMRFATVVVFEHVVFLLQGILAYAIPDVPFSVKEHIKHTERQNKKLRTDALNEKYLQERGQGLRPLDEISHYD